MAITVNEQRPFGKSIFASPAAPKRFFPAASGASGKPGDLVTVSSGYAALASNTATTNILGICEGTYSSLSQGDQVLSTIALPTHFYEFTLSGTASASQRFSAYRIKDGTDGNFAIIDGSTTGNVVIIVEFLGELAKFETNGFTDRYGNDNAGTWNYPYSQYGGIGDTNARVVVTFHPDACALTA